MEHNALQSMLELLWAELLIYWLFYQIACHIRAPAPFFLKEDYNAKLFQ
jgi:hypothetical protein